MYAAIARQHLFLDLASVYHIIIMYMQTGKPFFVEITMPVPCSHTNRLVQQRTADQINSGWQHFTRTLIIKLINAIGTEFDDIWLPVRTGRLSFPGPPVVMHAEKRLKKRKGP